MSSTASISKTLGTNPINRIEPYRETNVFDFLDEILDGVDMSCNDVEAPIHYPSRPEIRPFATKAVRNFSRNLPFSEIGGGSKPSAGEDLTGSLTLHEKKVSFLSSSLWDRFADYPLTLLGLANLLTTLCYYEDAAYLFRRLLDENAVDSSLDNHFLLQAACQYSLCIRSRLEMEAAVKYLREYYDRQAELDSRAEVLTVASSCLSRLCSKPAGWGIDYAIKTSKLRRRAKIAPCMRSQELHKSNHNSDMGLLKELVITARVGPLEVDKIGQRYKDHEGLAECLYMLLEHCSQVQHRVRTADTSPFTAFLVRIRDTWQIGITDFYFLVADSLPRDVEASANRLVLGLSCLDILFALCDMLFQMKIGENLVDLNEIEDSVNLLKSSSWSALIARVVTRIANLRLRWSIRLQEMRRYNKSALLEICLRSQLHFLKYTYWTPRPGTEPGVTAKQGLGQQNESSTDADPRRSVQKETAQQVLVNEPQRDSISTMRSSCSEDTRMMRDLRYRIKHASDRSTKFDPDQPPSSVMRPGSITSSMRDSLSDPRSSRVTFGDSHSILRFSTLTISTENSAQMSRGSMMDID